jgi:hypothetical protein
MSSSSSSSLSSKSSNSSNSSSSSSSSAWYRAAKAYDELVRYAASRAQQVKELHAWFSKTLNPQSLQLVKPDLEALAQILRPLEALTVVHLQKGSQGCLPANVVVVPQEFMPMLDHAPALTQTHYFVAHTLEATFSKVCSAFANCKAYFSSLQKFNELLNQQFVLMNRRNTLFARPVSDAQKQATRAALYSVISTVTRVPMLASALNDAVSAALASPSSSIKTKAADFVACTKKITLELDNCACMRADLESMAPLCRLFRSTRSVEQQECTNKACATINERDLAVVCPNVNTLVKKSATAPVRGGGNSSTRSSSRGSGKHKHSRDSSPKVRRRKVRKQQTKKRVGSRSNTNRMRNSKGRFVAAPKT